MTVEELIEQLREFSPDAVVIIQMDVLVQARGEEFAQQEQRVPNQLLPAGNDYVIIAE